MRYKLTVILILLNLALFGTIFYLDREPEADNPLGKRIFRPGVVERTETIRFADAEGTVAWSLEKREDTWELQEPFPWPVNEYAIRRILSQLETLEWKTRFLVSELRSAGQSLADYGLENPAASVVLESPADETRLAIGAATEIGNHLYLRTPDGAQIAVVGREDIDSLGLPLSDLRDSRVFSIPIFEVRSLRIALLDPGNITIRLARQGADWLFELPFEDRADPGAVETTLASLTAVEVGDFALGNGQADALATPAMRVTLEGNRRRETLILGPRQESPEGAFHLARLERRATPFRVSAEPFEVLRRAQESLREKRFFEFSPDLATGLRIRQGDRETVLRRLETGSWRVLPDSAEGAIDSWPAEEPVVERLLDRLASLEAVEFISDAPSAEELVRFGFDDPQRVVTVELTGNARTLRLGEIAPSDRGLLLYATRAGANFIYKVRPEILAATRLSPLHYKDRRIQSLPADSQITRIALLDRRSGDADAPVIWELTGNAATRAEFATEQWGPSAGEAVSRLNAYLKDLRARDFVLQSFADPLRLDEDTAVDWTSRLLFEFRTDAPNRGAGQVRELWLTDRVGGITRFAGSPDLDLVFTLPTDLIEALEAFPREPLPAPAVPEAQP